MEHRHSVRKPVNINVVIRSCDGAEIVTQARNVSAFGMHVDLPHRTKIVRNSIVTVQFDGGANTETLTALVIQAGPRGLGLMFTGGRDDALRKLLISAADMTH